jgi:hypothetical protein
VPTPNTARRCGDAANFPEHVWNDQRFSASGIEHWNDLAIEMDVVPPEFQRQRSLDAMEENPVPHRRSSAFRWHFQLVFCNQQVVSLFAAEHL